MFNNERKGNQFAEAVRKDEPVFVLYSENPDNIPCQSIRMEHKFQDKANLCRILHLFVDALENEIENDLEMQGFIEAERNGKLC